jgi:hypothetical protein
MVDMELRKELRRRWNSYEMFAVTPLLRVMMMMMVEDVVGGVR